MSRRGLMLGFVVCLALADCGGGPSTLPTTTTGQSLSVHSSAFEDGGAIPVAYSCDGDAKRPPPLSWTGVPEGTKELAIVVEDPDARGFLHWLVTGIPAGTTQVDGTLPSGAVEGKNQLGKTGWTPVCPPKGTHHYQFAVYALDAPIDPQAGNVLAQIDEHAIASGKLGGTYRR